MCRSIKRLRRPEAVPTEQELHDAALQFVRKISGYREPSQSNRVAFNKAVTGVTVVARRMFDHLNTGRDQKMTARPARSRKASAHR